MPAKNDLTKRMKEQYEFRFRHHLPRRTYVMVRCDGRAFHTWTKGLVRPYDNDLMECMDAAALSLCAQAAGAQFAYVQSDEISMLLTDFAEPQTQAWFDNCQNKIESISASVVTAAFNTQVMNYVRQNFETNCTNIGRKVPNATFDARAFVIPDLIEVENYFIDRQKDAIRNSVMMLAQYYYSHKKLQGKNQAAQHEMIHQTGDNWAKHPNGFKNGRVICKSDGNWFVDSRTPVFTQARAYLRSLIPLVWDGDLIVRMNET